MPEPLTIFAALGSIAQDLLKEKAKSAAQRLMSKSPVKKALDTTCSHFDTRFAGLRDALERWIDCEAFKGQLESLTTGLSAKTEEQHVEVFIRESGLQFGTADGARTAAVVGYFYSQIYIELCKGDDGLGVVGARLASVDQKIDDQDSKLDQILGRLPQARHFQLTGRQKLVQRSLIDKSVPVADLYESALRVWGDDSNAKRLMLAAHSIREMMASLPKVLELPVLAGQGRLGDQMNALEPVWVSAKNSNCHREGEWAGEIDGPLQNLLKGLHMFFEWWTESRPRRREVAAQLFPHSAAAGMPLPETLEKRRVERWLTLLDFFVRVAHGSSATMEEFTESVDGLEQILLDTLNRRPSEDFSAIDAILAEELPDA